MAQKVKDKEYIIDLPKIQDKRGSLSFLEIGGDIPFDIESVFWTSALAEGHALPKEISNNSEMIIIVLVGTINVSCVENRTYLLDNPSKAIYIPQSSGTSIHVLQSNTICLFITSGNIRLGAQPESCEDHKFCGELTDPLVNFPFWAVDNTSVTVVRNNKDVPFQIKRVFFVYDIPLGQTRGEHAHIHCHEYLVAPFGVFDVDIDDGKDKTIKNLSQSNQGLYLKPGWWSKEYNFSERAVCLALTSDLYSEKDYIRDYSEFKKLNNGKASFL